MKTILVISTIWFLAGCASPSAVVPGDLIKPPCRPSAATMLPAEPLPIAREGANMVATLALWAKQYRALARRMGDLQKHIVAHCS